MKRRPVRRRRQRSPFRAFRAAGLFGVLAFATAVGLEPSQFETILPGIVSSLPPTVRDILPVAAKDDAPSPVALVGMVRPMPLCGGGRRISCVVDGDTFWVSGEKVRLEGIDAPEIKGACAHERDLAQRATRRLSEILSGQNFALERSGTDRFGRTLARAKTPIGEAGEILVREGLARPWRGRKEQWCS